LIHSDQSNHDRHHGWIAAPEKAPFRAAKQLGALVLDKDIIRAALFPERVEYSAGTISASP
jgi:hypothetical protein